MLKKEKKEKKQDEISNKVELLFNSVDSPFTRFKISVKTGNHERIDAFWGCIFPNSKVVMYQPNTDMIATYSNLELFIHEFTVTLGYDITFLDNVIKLNNKIH
jgi:hypothetical protein